MHFIHSFAALAAFLSVVVSLPLTSNNQFTVKQVDSGRKRLRSGPHEIQKTFKKFGVPLSNGKNALAARASSLHFGTDSANPDMYDAAYLTPVLIGTPAQQLMLDFDTGSSDLWVFSTSMPSSEQQGHTKYDPSSSSTSRQLQGQTFNVTYGDGSGAEGTVYQDVVSVGGVVASSQAVETATDVSEEFAQESALDGLLGLGGPLNNQVYPDQQSTFFTSVRSILAKPVFAAYLQHQAAGAYDFGFLNQDHYTGSVYYTPLDTSDGYYQITTEGYSVGSQTQNDPLTSIVDTGTVRYALQRVSETLTDESQSLIFQSQNVVDAYYSQVPSARYDQGAGGMIFHCNETNLPSFGIEVGGSMRSTPGSYINYAPLTSDYCFGGIQASEGLPFGILGDVFLKSQYVVFDNGNIQLGFADQK